MINRPENIYTYLTAGLLLVLSVILVLWAYFIPAFTEYEAHFMEVARKMVNSGQWGLPRLESGQLLYHTPIFPYWLAGAGYALIPDGYAGYRLISLILSVSGLWGYYTVIRKYLDARTAFYSICVLVASLPFTFQVFLSTPGSMWALFNCTALFGFYIFLKTNRKSFLWLMYLALAFGVLSKGLVALLLPLIVMAVHLMFRIKMSGHTIQKLKPGMGLLILLVLITPWFAYVAYQTDGEWLISFLQENHWARYTAEHLGDPGTFYLPFVYIFVELLPFGVFLLFALGTSWKYRVKKDFLLLAVLSVFISLFFFGFFDTFFPHYLLPVLPFGAILIGFRFSQMAGRSLPKMKIWFGLGMLLVFMLGTVVGAYLLLNSSVIEFGHLILFYLSLLLLPLGAVGSVIFWMRKRTDEGMLLLSICSLLFNGIMMYLLTDYGIMPVFLEEVLL